MHEAQRVVEVWTDWNVAVVLLSLLVLNLDLVDLIGAQHLDDHSSAVRIERKRSC